MRCVQALQKSVAILLHIGLFNAPPNTATSVLAYYRTQLIVLPCPVETSTVLKPRFEYALHHGVQDLATVACAEPRPRDLFSSSRSGCNRSDQMRQAAACQVIQRSRPAEGQDSAAHQLDRADGRHKNSSLRTLPAMLISFLELKLATAILN